MRLILVIVVLLMAPTEPGHAHDACAKAKCQETKLKIRKIQAKMRRGYTRAQGEKMQAELRYLRALRSQRCR